MIDRAFNHSFSTNVLQIHTIFTNHRRDKSQRRIFLVGMIENSTTGTQLLNETFILAADLVLARF